MKNFRISSLGLVIGVAFSMTPGTERIAMAAPTTANVVAPRQHATLSEFAHARMASRFVARAARVPRAWVKPDALRAISRNGADAYLLYVSATPASGGTGFVNVYLGNTSGAPQPLVGQVTGLDAPAGLAVDARGTLYVAQGDVGAPVLVFPMGAAAPSLQLDTQGTFAVGVAVDKQRNVYVSTATADVFVYPAGATEPALHYSSLSGDGIPNVATDQSSNIYFLGEFFRGAIVGEITPHAQFTLGRFSDHPTGLTFDNTGNGLTIRGDGRLDVYAHHTAHLLYSLPVQGFQSLTLSDKDVTFYTATGTVFEYAYPSGALVAKITGLENYETFGMATYPASPLGPAW